MTEAIKQRRAAISRLQQELEILERAQALLNGQAAAEVVVSSGTITTVGAYVVKGGRKRGHPMKGRLNPKSQVSYAMIVLREAGVPLHIDDIVDRMAKLGQKAKKNSIGSTLAKLAKHGRLFYRASQASTFGLLEWQQIKGEDSALKRTPVRPGEK